ncbi:MAG: hypothetical protein ACI8X5_001245 [Planctomycetota bacterium]|jgi:hypothetical protein
MTKVTDPLVPQPALPSRSPTSGIDVVTTLAHFAIVTYLVDPQSLRRHLHSRFEPTTVLDDQGRERALVSVVPFLDLDFRLASCPWPKRRFGQINYRAYVIDTKTGEHVAWFFGTSLDSVLVNIPRHAWKLPWHRGRIRFDVNFDESRKLHTKYCMTAKSEWAPAELELEDSGRAVHELCGFEDFETGFRLLTHPIIGVFHRTDGKLGSYSIWHGQMCPTSGNVQHASFPLLDRLGLVEEGSLEENDSVMMQPVIDFTIYLPPVCLTRQH